MAWRRHALKWAGWSSLGLALLLFAGIGAGLFWLASSYSLYHPLSLDAYLPRIEGFLARRGLNVQIGHLELFYDEAPVVRLNDVRVMATSSDEPAVVIENVAVKFANRRLFTLNLSPKVVEAQNVTLRLIRTTNGASIAGMNVVDVRGAAAPTRGGVVEWLNTLYSSPEFGRLKDIKVENLNLLLRDEVQNAEWVLENARMSFTRYPADGERGSLTASIRRLYGHGGLSPDSQNVVMPVLITFDHQAGAAQATLTARFDQTDTDMIADYLPPKLKDMLKAQGSVELGTELLAENRFGQPWMTLRLNNAVMRFPEGFSKPLEFPRLTVTASYQTSPVDVLDVKGMTATSKRGNVWQAHGTVTSLTTDPLIDLWVSSDKGDIQGVFDLFPDQARGFDKALRWLRPNIKNADYVNLKGHYRGKPSAFPDCEEQCGLFDISADVTRGEVRFLPELTPAVGTSITFVWQGTQMTIAAPVAKIGNQQAKDIKVMITKMFSPDPSHILVSGELNGELKELLGELRKLDDAGLVPTDAGGRYQGKLFVDVPMIRGKETKFSDTTVTVDGKVTDLRLAGVKELGGQELTAPSAVVRMFPDKSLRLEADGKLGANPLKVVWQRGIDPAKPTALTLNIEGALAGNWLMERMGKPEGLVLQGPFQVAANLVESPKKDWRFGIRANADRGRVEIAKLNLKKPAGEKMALESQGVFGSDGGVVLNKVQVTGDNARVAGNLSWNPKKPDETVAKLSPFRMGRSDVVIDYAARKASITGKRLDIAGLDLFGDNKDKSDDIQNAELNLDVAEILTEKGKLDQVKGQMNARNGRWDIQHLSGLVNGQSKVSIRLVPIARQGERRKLSLNVDDLGATLSTLGIYQRLQGGRLNGDITYDSPQVGGGVLKVTDFSLQNPPIMMQILSLVSLEQLVAGTDSTLFKTATLPVRLDGGQVYLDNASLEGPSMSIRLNGVYDREKEDMNLDGKLAPGIPLNRLVAKIPLLGGILTGSQDGLVVVDFKLKGPSSDPQVNVRPLSVVTPGLLKDVWRGLTTSGQENVPTPKVIDGSKK